MSTLQRCTWFLALCLAGCGEAPIDNGGEKPPTMQGSQEGNSTGGLEPDNGSTGPGNTGAQTDQSNTGSSNSGSGSNGGSNNDTGSTGVDPTPPGACGSYDQPLNAPYPAEEGKFLEFMHDGLARQYKVFVPSSYTNDEPMPVLFLLHGMSGKAEAVGFKGTQMHLTAEKHGFILVLPSGYETSWHSGDCCGPAEEKNVDDVGFLREVHKHLTSELGLCIDQSRIYATGYSNGAFMMYTLACQASDVFAAVASVGGTMNMDKPDCEATFDRPIPVLEVHGSIDIIAPMQGKGVRGTRFSVDSMVELNGCSKEPVKATVPVTTANTISCETYPNCSEDVEVTFCLAPLGGHCWFGSETCGTGKEISSVIAPNVKGLDTSEGVWAFVSRFKCEECAK